MNRRQERTGSWSPAGLLLSLLLPFGGAGLAGCSGEARELAATEGLDADQLDEAERVFQMELEEGLAEFSRLCAAGKLDEAARMAELLRARAKLRHWPQVVEGQVGRMVGPKVRGVSGRLLGGLGLTAKRPAVNLTEALDAQLHWSLGAGRAKAGAVESAAEDFELVRSRGTGETRLNGIYGLGWLDLELAEQLYENIPEVSGASLDPMSPGFQPPAGAPATGGEEEPDPLPLARAGYEEALEHFIERLRLDWEDADTRANVELIQRRLRRLDEIEDERRGEEGTDRSQDKPEDEDKQEDDSQESSGDKGAPSDEEQEEDPEQSSEESAEDQEGQEQDSSEENEEQESGDQDEQPEGEQDGEQQEVHLTEEQMKRLLETTQQHNQEGEEMREVMKQQGRQATERDW